MFNRFLRCSLLFFSCIVFTFSTFAQIDKITVDLEKDKPEKFKTKTLKSEKTGNKKFTIPRHVIQNTVTHYNYYFNANNKLNAVIERARIANKENYANILPFYGYSLYNTAAQKSELDSVIYKATAGILLHDLRNDWVDNLYFLIGKSYYLRRDFDSAAMTFQFINYNLYPRKRNNDDQLVVGTNDKASGNIVSIANKENSSLLTKTFSTPPSRNDALVWQIRTLTETEDYPEAAGLINTLQTDPNFPGRLKAELEEVNAYWFYKQQMYDSSAYHLEKALSTADDKQDKARWEFLLAQLFEVSKQTDKAAEYYTRAMHHTTDPLLDIYANLNKAKMYRGDDPKAIDNSIANLVHMAKQDKFGPYRDIVYFSAGDLALLKKDTSEAMYFYKKSIFYNENDIPYKNKAFLTMAEISYGRKDYKNSYNFYDSLQTSDTTLGNIAQIEIRKNNLSKIVEQINIIDREDSLQMIAFMSPADREAFIKKISRKLRKERGLKDDESTNNTSAFLDINNSNNFNNLNAFNSNNNNSNADIFNGNSDTRGDWYFYNTAVKSKGFSDFISKWGKRPDIDNWRRNSVVASSLNGSININGVNANTGDVDQAVVQNNNTSPAIYVQNDITYSGLMENIPLTPEKLQRSNKLVSVSLFELGKLYQNSLEDYYMAIETYEKSLQRFPDSLYGGELYLNLSYCYQKTGNIAKASFYKNLLTAKFKESKFSDYITNPQASLNKNGAATSRYENIYNLFIEGNFDKALQEKKSADSVYGENYWSPQLLYIESVYYIKQRQDSIASNVLNKLIVAYPASPLKNKAERMVDVLKRRNDIEKYLTDLQIERAKEDAPIVVSDDNPPPVKNNNPPVVIAPIDHKKDSIAKKNAPVVSGSFTFDPLDAHYVIMILDKVDPVYVSEARNAFNRYDQEKFSAQNIQITKDAIDKDKDLLVFSQFPNSDAAVAYALRIRKDAGGEISWLAANKYSFLIISNSNLQVLKANKDIQTYIKLLNTKYPGKF
ncbi:MAG: tetratricopeptide repeat protein [Chitinophagaceae bacterium]|nr:tetratricopeptide repeat protein [Chitinophagaceae bacterium]